MSKQLKTLLAETTIAFRTPTLKQKEAYGRLSLTFCAASMIGAVTVIFTEGYATFFVLAKIAALIFLGSGTILYRGNFE